jgi:Flp pilus assembly pilin Flp
MGRLAAICSDERGIETLEWLAIAVLLLAVAFALYPTTLQGGLVTVVSNITSFLSTQAASVGGGS